MKFILSEFFKKEHKIMYFHIFISLFIGSFIYLTWRSKDILLFKIIDILNLMDIVDKWRGFFDDIYVHNIILYSLPDMCWVYAFTIYLGVLTSKPFISKKIQMILLYIPLLLGVLSEVGQLFIIPGTFDFFDIMAYCAGYLFSYISLCKYDLIQIYNEK